MRLSFMLFFYRALAHAALGRTDRAEHDFGQAVRLDPGLARQRTALRDNLAAARLAAQGQGRNDKVDD